MDTTTTKQTGELAGSHYTELLAACKAAVAALSQPVQFTKFDRRVFDTRPIEILRGDAKFARETLQAALANVPNELPATPASVPQG